MAARIEDHAADQLHVEMSHPQGALGRLANHCKSFGQHVRELGAVGDLLAEITRTCLQRLIGQRLGDRLQGVDPLDEPAEGLDLAFVNRTEEFLGDPHHASLSAASLARRCWRAMYIVQFRSAGTRRRAAA